MKTAVFSFRELAPIFFAIFIDIMSFGLAFPVLTALFTTADSGFLPADTSQEIRYLYLSIGLLLSPLFMFFGASFMGDLSDVIGRKKVLIVCMLGLCISFFLMGSGIKSGLASLIFIGRGLSGLMAGSMPVALASIVDLSTPENKAVHMSLITLVQSVGFVIGPFLGGVFSHTKFSRFFDFSLPFFIAAILSLLAVIWVWTAFAETFVRKNHHKLDFRRVFLVFVEVSKHRAIRILSLAFLAMQMGIALYLQLILIFFQKKYRYSSFGMGLFNAFLGFWFAICLIFVIPRAVKRYRVEWIAFFGLLITGICQLLASFLQQEWMQLMVAVPLAIALQTAFVTMLTSFSNAAEANSQGWAMGISAAVIAISFAATAFSPLLVPLMGTQSLIFIGALLMFGACLLMLDYCKRVLPTIHQ